LFVTFFAAGVPRRSATSAVALVCVVGAAWSWWAFAL
jgi:hypothetical protein